MLWNLHDMFCIFQEFCYTKLVKMKKKIVNVHFFQTTKDRNTILTLIEKSVQLL